MQLCDYVSLWQVNSLGTWIASVGDVSVGTGITLVAGGLFSQADVRQTAGTTVLAAGALSVTTADTAATALDVYSSLNSFSGTTFTASVANTPTTIANVNVLQLLRGTTSVMKVSAALGNFNCSA